MRVEAGNLQEAFQKAADEFSCSVTELDIEIIQHPRMGLLGFFKKAAIIEVYKEGMKPSRKERASKNKNQTTKAKREAPRRKKEKVASVDMKKVLPEIKKGVEQLVKDSCFDMHVLKVEKFTEDTILIELNGEDAALLIGKEGYRYKAFSYLLYNWINIKYGFGIRLEIAEFLKNQEIMIDKYLTSIIERVQNNGRAQTKPLDGVLIKIALGRLRERFPEKYVGIKTGREGVKFIVINDFNRK